MAMSTGACWEGIFVSNRAFLCRTGLFCVEPCILLSNRAFLCRTSVIIMKIACSMSKLQNRLPLVVENVSWRRRKVVPAQTLCYHYLCCFFLKVHKDVNTFQWNHRTTMANHSFPRYSDVWRFCSNDFIFVMSTCRIFIRSGRGQGKGVVPLLTLCQACGGHPNDP